MKVLTPYTVVNEEPENKSPLGRHAGQMGR